MAVVALLSCVLTLGIAARLAHADDQDCDALPTAVVHHEAGSRPQHVFIIVLENESYDETFGPDSKAPYLSKCLTKKGQLLTNYYAIGHFSLDNYIAMISGQSPNPDTQLDCSIFNEFALTKPGLDANGQAVGHGCVYPADVSTIANQLEARHLKWRGYMEDMKGGCQHPPLNEADPYQRARSGSEYATKHNPFVYFHSISDEDCMANDVPLINSRAISTQLKARPTYPSSFPTFATTDMTIGTVCAPTARHQEAWSLSIPFSGAKFR